MTAPDLTFAVFAICNVLRVLAYVPQMAMIACRPNGAVSFSFATWSLFAAANTSTAIYAAHVLSDVSLACVHGFNALCCAIVLGLALWRRRWPVVTGQVQQ